MLLPGELPLGGFEGKTPGGVDGRRRGAVHSL